MALLYTYTHHSEWPIRHASTESEQHQLTSACKRMHVFWREGIMSGFVMPVRECTIRPHRLTQPYDRKRTMSPRTCHLQILMGQHRAVDVPHPREVEQLVEHVGDVRQDNNRLQESCMCVWRGFGGAAAVKQHIGKRPRQVHL